MRGDRKRVEEKTVCMPMPVNICGRVREGASTARGRVPAPARAWQVRISLRQYTSINSEVPWSWCVVSLVVGHLYRHLGQCDTHSSQLVLRVRARRRPAAPAAERPRAVLPGAEPQAQEHAELRGVWVKGAQRRFWCKKRCRMVSLVQGARPARAAACCSMARSQQPPLLPCPCHAPPSAAH